MSGEDICRIIGFFHVGNPAPVQAGVSFGHIKKKIQRSGILGYAFQVILDGFGIAGPSRTAGEFSAVELLIRILESKPIERNGVNSRGDFQAIERSRAHVVLGELKAGPFAPSPGEAREEGVLPLVRGLGHAEGQPARADQHIVFGKVMPVGVPPGRGEFQFPGDSQE